MFDHKPEFSVIKMASIFGVSRSGFYMWQKQRHQKSMRQQLQIQRDEKVKNFFEASKHRYGARRILQDLQANEQHCDLKTITKSMKRQGLVAKAAKKFKNTTDSNHSLPIADNILARDFVATHSNQKLVSDITYIQTTEGWLYLAVILDLYSRKVIGWSMNERMTVQIVCDALQMALFRRKSLENAIIHSDRGGQYCANDYRELLKKHSLIQSMSRKGNCWDNAVAESFFHSLKVETLHGEKMMDRESTRQAVFEYIEVDYNQKRRHSSLGYLSPLEYEMKFMA